MWGGDPDCAHVWGTVERKRGGSYSHEGDRKSVAGDTVGALQGWRCAKCGAWLGCLGNEPHPEMYVEHLLEVFRELRRVLRDDGVFFLNLGDSFNGSGGAGGDYKPGGLKEGQRKYLGANVASLQPKDLVGIPWRVAFAMQAEGWLLRCDCVWAKGVSGQKELKQQVSAALQRSIGLVEHGEQLAEKMLTDLDLYVGNCMPEPCNGWRWERHRIKNPDAKPQVVDASKKQDTTGNPTYTGFNERYQGKIIPRTIDCPGCPKCDANGGYVLKRGSWRPTRAHEYIFLFANSGNYFCDADAIREPLRGTTITREQKGYNKAFRNQFRGSPTDTRHQDGKVIAPNSMSNPAGRNRRSVWTIGTRPSKVPHAAMFPEAIPEVCIRVGTSEGGCCSACGAPLARVIGRTKVVRPRPTNENRCVNAKGYKRPDNDHAGTAVVTLGWKPTCDCAPSAPIPCTVLDPFSGVGTTSLVAKNLGRSSIGIEIGEEYVHLSEDRIFGCTEEEGLPVDVGRCPS